MTTKRKKPANESRRLFLKRSAVAAGGSLAGIPALSALAAKVPPHAENQPLATAGVDTGGYGSLSPVADANDGALRLALPQGFNYISFSVGGTPMSDGNPVPGRHDGMAAFPLSNGNVRLIRNHENGYAPRPTPLPNDPWVYDRWSDGGTTSLEVAVNADGSASLVRDFLSLQGTSVNCAGGPMPWGAWLTCEETTAGQKQGFQQDHGFVFEVPVQAEDSLPNFPPLWAQAAQKITPATPPPWTPPAQTDFPVPAVPLKAMGRFAHEAVAMEPATGIIYETEDSSFNPDDPVGSPGGGFYRFIPAHYRFGERPDLTQGKLQVLKIRGQSKFNTSSGLQAGQELPVEWVDIDDPNPPEAETDSSAVFRQGLVKGAAIFQRPEGCWHGNGSVFFNTTEGGDAGEGQVWEYRSLSRNFGVLRLIFESPGERLLDNPDNITVSPRGGLVLCEDGNKADQLRGFTRGGRIFDFAKNLVDGGEWAGATFSPNAQTLFVNIQSLKRTFAIWGPWERGAL